MLDYELKKEYPFTPKEFTVDEHNKISYVDEGSGEVFLMLHGNPTWSFYYRNLIKYFSKGYRVIAPDHIGCGLSSKPQEYSYTLEQHVENLKALLLHLNIEKINLIVHDWGGAIGFGLATKHPHLFKKIIITNTAAFTSPTIPFRINILKTPILGPLFIRLFNGFAGPATFMASSNGLSPVEKRGFLYPYNNFKNRIATSKFVQDIPMSKDHPTYSYLKDIEDNLNKLTCPKLILWGEKDFCFHTYYRDRWLKYYPEAKLVSFPDANHYVIEDKQDECIREIERFLNG